MKINILIILFSLFSNGLYSQELQKKYWGITADSIHLNHYLEFKNDSIVELTSIHRHMQPQLKIQFRYKSENQNISITKNRIEKSDNDMLNGYGFSQYSNSIQLNIDSKALLDRKNRVVYVLLDDFRKGYYTTYIIDNKEYKQDDMMTNSYGLVEKRIKTNRKLKRKLKSIKKDLENDKYSIKIYKGIDAYLKFGYDKVLGVIELLKNE